MKIEMWCINKTSQKFIRDGIDLYVKRLGHYISFDLTVIPAPKSASKLPLAKLKLAEAELVLHKLKDTDHLILLDEKGKEYSSIEFSKQLQKLQMSSNKRVVFLIGGGYGFAESLKARSNSLMSLSKMTFPHELVRVIFLEQLYRACTINKGEKYHHS